MIKLTSVFQRTFAYSLFDFANSAFVLIVHAFLFPLYFKNVLFAGAKVGDFAWGTSIAISVGLAMAVAPALGAVADAARRFRVFAIVGILSFATAVLLGFSIGSSRINIIVAFVVANTFFYLALNLYNSLLTVVVDSAGRIKLSGFAWGFGYLGGILCFAGSFFLQRRFGIDSQAPYLFTGCFYLLFGSLAVWLLRPYASAQIARPRVALGAMLNALDLPRLKLLTGYWLISDALSTVIVFVAIYGSNQLNLSTTAIGAFLLLIQLFAFPATYIVAKMAHNIGMNRVLSYCVYVWIAIICLLSLNLHFNGLVLIALLTSTVIGSTQALMRAQYSLLLDGTRTSELFSWFTLATESSAIVGPIVFGTLSIFAGQRIAMLCLILPLIAGILLVRSVVGGSAILSVPSAAK